MNKEEIKKALDDSDVYIVRIIEDLIDVLVRKGIIQPSYFNDKVRDKLDSRKNLRNLL